MNKSQPKIEVPLQSIDKLLDIAGGIMLSVLIILSISLYPKLPDQVSTHFDLSGASNKMGHKNMVLSLPIIALVMFGVMTYLIRVPHTYNYAVKITEENARKQYTISTRIIRYMRLMVCIIFTGILTLIAQTAMGKEIFPTAMFLPVLLALIFIPVMFMIYQSYEQR